eukprot:CFRG6241T1
MYLGEVENTLGKVSHRTNDPAYARDLSRNLEYNRNSKKSKSYTANVGDLCMASDPYAHPNAAGTQYFDEMCFGEVDNIQDAATHNSIDRIYSFTISAENDELKHSGRTFSPLPYISEPTHQDDTNYFDMMYFGDIGNMYNPLNHNSKSPASTFRISSEHNASIDNFNARTDSKLSASLSFVSSSVHEDGTNYFDEMYFGDIDSPLNHTNKSPASTFRISSEYDRDASDDDLTDISRSEIFTSVHEEGVNYVDRMYFEDVYSLLNHTKKSPVSTFIMSSEYDSGSLDDDLTDTVRSSISSSVHEEGANYVDDMYFGEMDSLHSPLNYNSNSDAYPTNIRGGHGDLNTSTARKVDVSCSSISSSVHEEGANYVDEMYFGDMDSLHSPLNYNSNSDASPTNIRGGHGDLNTSTASKVDVSCSSISSSVYEEGANYVDEMYFGEMDSLHSPINYNSNSAVSLSSICEGHGDLNTTADSRLDVSRSSISSSVHEEGANYVDEMYFGDMDILHSPLNYNSTSAVFPSSINAEHAGLTDSLVARANSKLCLSTHSVSSSVYEEGVNYFDEMYFGDVNSITKHPRKFKI